MGTMPRMNTYLKSLDEVITKKLLPKLIESIASGDERNLYLSIREGGLGIPVLE